MTHTPSLRSRLVILTLAAVTAVVLVVDVFVYVALQEELDDTLDEVVQARVQTVMQAARATTSPDQLVQELSEAGVPASVTTPEGRIVRTEPGQRLFDQLPPSEDAATSLQLREVVTLDDGTEVTVLASRGGTRSTLRQVLVLETIASLVVLGLAFLLVNRIARLVTRPVDRIVEIADRIADGETHLRIDPSDPTTEVGRMAAALDTVVGALDDALTSARRAEERSRAFLADAAHQLRTPVTGLRASAETLLTSDPGQEQDELLQAVARQAHRIGRLVDALLAMARLDRPEPIVRDHVDLQRLVQDELAHQGTLAPHLDFDLVTASDNDISVQGDALWLRAAVGNLLDNARRHAVSRVDVQIEELVGAWRTTVVDDGPGVPPDHRERIFDRFVSLDGEGSGLGLPIARAVAEAHEGSLRLADDEFELLLPTAASGVPRRIRHG